MRNVEKLGVQKNVCPAMTKLTTNTFIEGNIELYEDIMYIREKKKCKTN